MPANKALQSDAPRFARRAAERRRYFLLPGCSRDDLCAVVLGHRPDVESGAGLEFAERGQILFGAQDASRLSVHGTIEGVIAFLLWVYISAVIFLFELVVAAIASYYLANEVMTWNEWVGGLLIVAASLALERACRVRDEGSQNLG